jgi:hypothetical protein
LSDKEEGKPVGDEYVEEEEVVEEEKKLEGMYDLVLPIGISEKIIYELLEKFDLEVVKRTLNVQIVDGVEPRELIVLRGDLDTINRAHDYLYTRLKERYGSR